MITSICVFLLGSVCVHFCVLGPLLRRKSSLLILKLHFLNKTKKKKQIWQNLTIYSEIEGPWMTGFLVRLVWHCSWYFCKMYIFCGYKCTFSHIMIKHKAIFVLTISRRCLIKYMHCINLLLLLVSWFLFLRLKCRIFTPFRVVFDRKSLIAFLLIFYWHKAQK